MHSDRTSSSRGANWALIVSFVLLLWLPIIDGSFHLDQTPAFNEKRLLAAYPSLKQGMKNLGEYARNLEAYFNDHFGWRKQLIHWHLLAETVVFKTKSSKGVVLGKSGWLFYSPPQEEYEMGLFSQQALQDYQKLLELRRDWLAKRGMHYLFVVAPHKQCIYSEYLPSPAARSQTRFDQLIAHMKSHSTVAVVDLRSALREAKRIAPTYFKTDSHWNDFGGFVASQEIINTLSKQLPDLHPKSLDLFAMRKEIGRSGDLAEILGVTGDDDQITLAPRAGLPELVETVQNPEFVRPTYFSSNFCAKGRAVVFRDSFGTALRPFLGYSFNKVSYIWTADDFDMDVVKQLKPDVVITQIVEHKLTTNGLEKKLRALESALHNPD